MSQSEAAEIKSNTVDDCTDQDAGARDQCAEARDVRSAVVREELSKCTDRCESTSACSTVTGIREGQHTPSTKCNMILGEESRSESLQQYIDSVQNDPEISEQTWLKMFGLTESQLRDTLEPVVENILEIFYFLKSGRLLAEHNSKEQLAGVFPQDVVESIWTKNKLSIFSILKVCCCNYRLLPK